MKTTNLMLTLTSVISFTCTYAKTGTLPVEALYYAWFDSPCFDAPRHGVAL
ncbi:hypothetical protein K1T71_005436 [Dendrolimus kikuchii]|uniref:Uncharacterized protein n=1 Tax=Dendrolimus kikuchii TaxID=765133 RepID=A0ACC1D493_9NEOP|nr:hypothetical protein K1T71_005436 [Dendrolimus kikuchii]